MLADDKVHGGVLECRDTSRFCKDVDTSERVPGNVDVIVRLLPEDSGVGPVLEIAEHLGIVLGQLDHLGLGFSEVSLEYGLEITASVTE